MNKNFTATSAAAAAFLLFSTVHAQTIRSFTPRFSDNVRGGMTFVSNSIMMSAGGGTDYTALPPGCGTATACFNNNNSGRNIDIDGDPSTQRSSSATLALPACNTVVYAGLYWAAGITTATGGMSRVGNGVVKFKAPGSTSYQTLTASTLDTFYNVFQEYQAYTDVTTLVQAAGAGVYTVADVACDTGKNNTHAGWTMIVVYRDSTQPTRNITVFDGISLFSGSGSVSSSITLTGFHAPPTGAVSAKIGVVCYDGDRSSPDSFSIRRNDNGVFINQTAAGESAASTSNNNDSWNSSITIDGANVTTRNPAYANTYGYDADVFTLANAGKTYIRNNDSSLTLRIGTPSEGYVLGVVATQVDVYAPEMLLEASTTDVNGGSYALGDTLLVNLSLRNTGTDTALNARIVEKLSPAFDFIPGSITVDGVAYTDATADDVADYIAATKTIALRVGTGATATTGGIVRSNGSDRFTASYRVRISTSCDSIGNTPATISRQATVFFNGVVDADPDTVAARPQPVGGCTQGPAPEAITVATGCSAPLPTGLLHFGGRMDNNLAVLNWLVQESAGTAAYEVMVSEDGRDFVLLYAMRAGLSGGVHEYRYADVRRVEAPRTYYRLGIRSASGAVHRSSVVVLERSAEGSAQPVLFPNPGSAELRILHAPSDAVVELYDVRGRRVAAGRVSAALPTAALPSGVYFVRIIAAGSHGVMRWVKE